MHATPGDRALSAVDVVARAVGDAARALRRLAVAAALAFAVIALYVFQDGWPDESGPIALRVVLLLLAAAPPVILFLFTESLRALAELPARIRATPTQARDRASDLARLSDDLRGTRTARVPFLLWRLTKLAGSSRELLAPQAAVLPLASVPFLLLSLWATAAAVLEIFVAFVLAILLAA